MSLSLKPSKFTLTASTLIPWKKKKKKKSHVLPKKGKTPLVFYKDGVFTLCRVNTTEPQGEHTVPCGEGVVFISSLVTLFFICAVS